MGGIFSAAICLVVLYAPLLFMERGTLQIWGWSSVFLGPFIGLPIFFFVSYQIGASIYRALAPRQIGWVHPVKVKGVESGRIEQLSFPLKGRFRIGVPDEHRMEVIAALEQFFMKKPNVASVHLGFLEILSAENESMCCYTLGIECSPEGEIYRETMEAIEAMWEAKWPISILPFNSQFL